MGASSSTGNGSAASSKEEEEQESLATSTGSLPFLRTTFSKLNNNNNHSSIPLSSLHDIFSITTDNTSFFSSESTPSVPKQFTQLLCNLPTSITSLLFTSTSTSTVSWIQFLTGYNNCCARMPASSSLNLLYRLYSQAIPSSRLEFNHDDDSKVVAGFFNVTDLVMLLWMCWMMGRSWRGVKGEAPLLLPDFRHLLRSALVYCGEEVGDGDADADANAEGVWDYDKDLEAQKVHMWVLATIPGLANCFSEYVREKLKGFGAAAPPPPPGGDFILPVGDSSSTDVQNTFLLKCGMAWAISLTLRNNHEELSGVSFPGLVTEAVNNILYRSSIHGKGMNRFWSNVEGYHGPLLIIILASSPDASQSDNSARRWIISILTDQGFENRETFYGNSGYLYAISPSFAMLSPSGKDKNFMYSHLHTTGKVYEAKPKPVGLAFGGTLGSERIFIDEDFAKVTVRHHAVDRTYQHGSLIPNQGFLPIEASLLEVEIWGFGGNAAKKQQDVYKKRESLFSDQRRKIDLKTFGNWEDSPEKMMMDMVTDPNRVRREER